MVNENKSNVFAAVAGVVVGAGAVIAGAVALSDKKNQKKVSDALAKGKRMVKEYVSKANERADEASELVEDKIAGGKKAVKKIIKTAKQEVRKI